MSTSSENDIIVAFEKLAITHSDINANINISHILEAIDHLKGISHKRLDVDSIFDFITRTTASNITKKALADIITDLVKQNIIVNKKSTNGRDSFRRSTTDKTSDIDNIQLQNEKGLKDNNKPNNSVQQRTHSFIETDIHTLCSSQQLAPENSTDTTSLNTITETFLSVPTDIQTPITARNLNDTSKFTQKSMLKIEAQLSALKSYVDCELSMLTSKINAFSDSLKHALANLQNRERNRANTDLLQPCITSLENELRSKDKIIQSLLETQNTLTNSLSTLKAKQPEPIIDLSQQQQWQHQKYLHQYHHHQQHQMDKQQQSQKQQPTEQFQKSLSSRQQKHQGLGNQKQFILGQDELDTLYVGNLSEDINESDLFELFGLHSTNYLRDNCDVQIPLSENTGKKRFCLHKSA